jgi:hypothetical protein
LWVVFVGLWIAKVDEQAVTEVQCYATAESFDRFRSAGMIAIYKVAPVLRI